MEHWCSRFWILYSTYAIFSSRVSSLTIQFMSLCSTSLTLLQHGLFLRGIIIRIDSRLRISWHSLRMFFFCFSVQGSSSHFVFWIHTIKHNSKRRTDAFPGSILVLKLVVVWLDWESEEPTRTQSSLLGMRLQYRFQIPL